MSNVVFAHELIYFYYPNENKFKTAGGHVVLNFYELVSPNMVFLFKHHKRTMTFYNCKHRIKVKLLYPKLS